MVEITSTIQCTPRTGGGKGMAHKLRASGMTPAVAYGPSSEPRLLALEPKLFGQQRRAFGLSYIYNVEVEGASSFKALIKDVQIDPITRAILHVDFYEVDMKKDIYVEVPIELTGKPVGVVDGGLLSQVLHTVEVKCLPDIIPAKLTADVSALNIGDVLHTDSIPLPNGVELTLKRPEAIAAVNEPEEEEEPVVAEGLEGELAEGEVPAEGEAAADGEAPAEGGEAPAEEKKDDDKKDKKDKKKG